MKTRTVVLGLAAAFALSLTGCISTNQTVYREEERVKVEFESDTAGRIFYEALSKARGSHNRSDSTTEVSLPIVFSHKHRVVEGESLAFNQAVRQCDTNGDGRITEQEARIFAESGSK